MERISFAVYNIILLLFSPVFFAVSLLLYLTKNKKGAGFPYKFFPSLPFLNNPLKDISKKGGAAGAGNIWIHAVSLGELRASVNFIKLLREKSGRNIYLSATTKTGYDFARKLYGGEKDVAVFYFPYDFRFSVGSVLKLVKPALFVSVETEIWPNLFRALGRKNIPAAVINARLSEKSYGNYLKFGFFFKYVFSRLSLVLCISDADRARFISLGVQAERVRRTGNMKYDMDAASITRGLEEKSGWLKRIFGGGKIVAAGSTHKGEEESILDAVLGLSVKRKSEAGGSGNSGGRIFLFIAPRHPERFDEVYAFLKERGVYAIRLSYIYSAMREGKAVSVCAPDVSAPENAVTVVLVDIIGELLAAYSVCDAAFVGGSMVAAGGHNMLEPLLFGKPAIFGSHVENFSEIAAGIVEDKAGKMVSSESELAAALSEYLYNDKAAEDAASAASSVISQNKGSSLENVGYLMRFLEKVFT